MLTVCANHAVAWSPSQTLHSFTTRKGDSAVSSSRLAKKKTRADARDEELGVFHLDVESYVTKSSEPDCGGE